jgi:type IV secretory pathway TrbL component
LPVVPDCNTQLNSLLDRATNAENQLKIANTTISDKDSQLKAANSSIKEKDSTIGEQSTFVAWSGIGCIILLITTIYYYKKCKELKK